MFELSQSNTPVSRKIQNKITHKEMPGASIAAYVETDGVGMGMLNNGTTYLTQRGLAVLCGVQNAHIGTISRDWNSTKPRIAAIRARLKANRTTPHAVLLWAGRRQHCYDPVICEAILDYYALDAGDHIQAEAQANRLRFKREDLGAYICKQFTPKPKPQNTQPLRFVPLRKIEPESYDAADAVIIYICGLYALSVWMANTYFEGLKQRALNAPWNRLGLYLPLKAMLEIQAEAILQASMAWQGQAPAAADAAMPGRVGLAASEREKMPA